MTDPELPPLVVDLIDAQKRQEQIGDQLADAMASISQLRAQLAEVTEERDRLQTRRDELLQLVRNISTEAITPEDADELRGQVAALIAEVGTLRTRVRQWEAIAERDHGKPIDLVDVEQLRAQLAELQKRADPLHRGVSVRSEFFAVKVADFMRGEIEYQDLLDWHRAQLAQRDELLGVAAGALEDVNRFGCFRSRDIAEQALAQIQASKEGSDGE